MAQMEAEPSGATLGNGPDASTSSPPARDHTKTERPRGVSLAMAMAMAT
jgi:hypothetical protein